MFCNPLTALIIVYYDRKGPFREKRVEDRKLQLSCISHQISGVRGTGIQVENIFLTAMMKHIWIRWFRKKSIELEHYIYSH